MSEYLKAFLKGFYVAFRWTVDPENAFQLFVTVAVCSFIAGMLSASGNLLLSYAFVAQSLSNLFAYIDNNAKAKSYIYSIIGIMLCSCGFTLAILSIVL